MKYCHDYVGVTCVNGNCPNVQVDYDGFPIHSKKIMCKDCWYYEGCKDCALYGIHCDRGQVDEKGKDIE